MQTSECNSQAPMYPMICKLYFLYHPALHQYLLVTYNQDYAKQKRACDILISYFCRYDIFIMYIDK